MLVICVYPGVPSDLYMEGYILKEKHLPYKNRVPTAFAEVRKCCKRMLSL
jgi:hypothetical protein